MIKVAILGATGYVGEELVRLLCRHPKVQLTHLSSHSYQSEPYSKVYPHFKGIVEEVCIEDDLDKIDADILFIALPHGFASKIVTPKLLKKTKVIDMGADFRLSKMAYDKWYQVEHFGEELLNEAVYGLSEWNREKIKVASLVANPGCYVTCSLLSLLPLVRENAIDVGSIIIDGKSGITGAGRGLSIGTHYTECNESMKAYGVATHRHTPEIEEKLKYFSGQSVVLTFTPHLVPMNRGILATMYGKLKKGVTSKEIMHIYKKYYECEKFIRLLDDVAIAETRWVKGSNFCDISFKVDERTGRVIIISALDNMMKGAAGQAVQNMNLMMGWQEDLGLDYAPVFPI